MQKTRNPDGANWTLASAHFSKVLDALTPVLYDPDKIVPFPPRPIPQGDTSCERMLSVAGKKIR